MDGPRRPEWTTSVRVAPEVTLRLDAPSAFASLAAVHEARRALQPSASTALLDALASLERELGLAIGADTAREFLKRRARRRRAEAG